MGEQGRCGAGSEHCAGNGSKGHAPMIAWVIAWVIASEPHG
jgi:hypothetical protein